MNTDASISSLKGIGEKTAMLYEKLGVHTVGELMDYYPRNYERYEKPITIRDAAVCDFAAIRVVICSVPTVRHIRNFTIVNTKVKDEEGLELRVTWYQMAFLTKTLKPGYRCIIRGRLKNSGKSRFMEQPQMFSEEEYSRLESSLQPVYSLTAGLSSKAISKAVRQAYDCDCRPRERVPEDIRKKYGLLPKTEAGFRMHFPKSTDDLMGARKSIVFEEFYCFLVGVRQMKENIEHEKNHLAITPRKEVWELAERLDYRLTDAQINTLKDISSDMAGSHMMNRMIQGDVGSGKTIVAFLAMYQTALCGYQSVLMAPTEVLAVQHFQTFSSLSERYGLGLRIVLLTGSLKAAEKREAYKAISSNDADIIVGTHALIQTKVEFAQPGLVITDEQHRFGVEQRDILKEKGHTPHILVMSATPIPRSLAIILYGDLDISIMDELPAKRLPIKNCTVNISYRTKAWDFIASQVKAGHQAYVICPMVEESEIMEGTDVVSYSKQLKDYLPENINVEFLHGKMKGALKEEIMNLFSENRIQVLVSTTVIEVGINVPNATVMLIEDAQRFGLAQLHQLRGRVGRGDAQSYCIMIDTSGNEEISERLQVLNKSNDGFVIANEDLRLRGPGDFFGIRQSGEIGFKVADIYQDAQILKQAAEAAEESQRLPVYFS